MNSNSGWTSTFGPQEDTWAAPPNIHSCSCFLVPHLCIHFSWSFKKEESIPTSNHSVLSFPSLLLLYSPGCSDHRQRNGQANAQTGPHERGRLRQEPASKDGDKMVNHDASAHRDKWEHSCQAPLKQSHGIYNKMEKRRKPSPDYWATVNRSVPWGWLYTSHFHMKV